MRPSLTFTLITVLVAVLSVHCDRDDSSAENSSSQQSSESSEEYGRRRVRYRSRYRSRHRSRRDTSSMEASNSEQSEQSSEEFDRRQIRYRSRRDMASPELNSSEEMDIILATLKTNPANTNARGNHRVSHMDSADTSRESQEMGFSNKLLMSNTRP